MNKQQELPKLDIEYWDNEDGSVGARLETFHDGDIWAKDFDTLAMGIIFLMDHMMEAERRRQKNNAQKGMFGGGMNAMIDGGDLLVRWPQVKGFGVSFKSKDNFVSWMGEVLKIAIEAEQKKGKK
jgi:hypothetical protein